MDIDNDDYEAPMNGGREEDNNDNKNKMADDSATKNTLSTCSAFYCSKKNGRLHEQQRSWMRVSTSSGEEAGGSEEAEEDGGDNNNGDNAMRGYDVKQDSRDNTQYHNNEDNCAVDNVTMEKQTDKSADNANFEEGAADEITAEVQNENVVAEAEPQKSSASGSATTSSTSTLIERRRSFTSRMVEFVKSFFHSSDESDHEDNNEVINDTAAVVAQIESQEQSEDKTEGIISDQVIMSSADNNEEGVGENSGTAEAACKDLLHDDKLTEDNEEACEKGVTTLTTTDGCRMAFTPSDSSVYGGELLTVAFSDPVKLSGNGPWYFVFEGNKQRHVTTGRKVNATTLQAVIPPHREAETVQLTIMCQSSSEGRSQLGCTTFTYYYDSSHQLVLYLMDSVYDPASLEHPERIHGNNADGEKRFDLVGEDLDTLDQRLMRAFLHMDVPENWHILGHDGAMAEPPARESLLHFAARLGLQQFTEVLMAQVGSFDALGLPNHHGLLPLDIAQQAGNEKLVATLLGRSYYDCGGPHWLDKKRRQQAPTIIKQHDHGLATVTNNLTKSQKTLDDDIALLHDMTSLMLQQQQQQKQQQQQQQHHQHQPQQQHHHQQQQQQQQYHPQYKQPSPPHQSRVTSEGDSAAPPPELPPRRPHSYMMRRPPKGRTHSDGVIREEPEYERGYHEDDDDDDDSALHRLSSSSQPDDSGSSSSNHRYKRRMHRQDSYHSRRHYKRQTTPSGGGGPPPMPPARTQSTGSLPSSSSQHTPALTTTGSLEVPPTFMPPPPPRLPERDYNMFRSATTTDAGAARTGADVVRTGPAPEPKPGVLEDNLRRLHEIHEGIHKLRELGTQQQQNPPNARAETLQRFSRSCPSLADQVLKAAVPNQTNNNRHSSAAHQYSDHYKSMVDLGHGGQTSSFDAGSLDTSTHGSLETSKQMQRPTGPFSGQGQGVQICINDVTLDASDDYNACGGGGGGRERGNSDGFLGDDNGLLDPELRMIDELKKSHRRSSWCPEEGRKKEDRHEKQRMMLAVAGRSQSLSSLDGNDEDSDTDGSVGSSYKTRSQDDTGRLPVADDISDLANLDDVEDYDLDLDSSYHGDEECDSPVHHTSTHKQYIEKNSSAIKSSSPGRAVGDITIHSSPDLHKVSGVEGDGMSPSTLPDPPSSSSSPLSAVTAATVTVTSLTMPPNLMKSVSTPSIATASDTASTTAKGHDLRQGSTSDADASEGPDTPRDGSPPCPIRRLLAEHDAQVAKQSAGEDNDTDNDNDSLTAFLQSEDNKPRLSMIEYLQPAPKNLIEEERKKKGEPKEEKKRRSSVFSKLGSYRQKKVAKDNKLIRNTHEFVSVSFSNSTSCDVCSRSMANKPALQCENCMVNVHENSCKDQIAPCARLKSSPRMHKYQSASLPEGHGNNANATMSNHLAAAAGTNLKGSQSFKECKRAVSVPSTRPALQISQSGSNLLPRSSSPSGSTVGASGSASAPASTSAAAAALPSSSGTGYFQWRRVATKLGIDKVISEEREKEGIADGTEEGGGTPPPRTPPVSNHMLSDSNIVDTLSNSIESLDEANDVVAELSDDPDLSVPTEAEPEAWSVTVDKKTLKKMSAKDIKRQDHIWELIQTEKSHCRTLKIIQRVFVRGMLKECNLSTGTVERVFPKLSDLLDIHLHFLHRLQERQRLRPDKSVENVGDVLRAQFEGEMGNKMKLAYGEFCSRHNESVQLYKDILKSDRKFQAFIKKCSRNNVCKRLGIPECILLVTQRMTKYPILIESIIKATKDNKLDRECLTTVLRLTRDILNYVDQQVDEREKEQKLFEIYNKLDARQSTTFKANKFKKSDLLMNSRKLLHEGSIKWMSARGKPCEVIAVILSDLMFFLLENNQKYSFFAQDNKSSVISLSKLLVREKGDTRDSKGIYLICQSKTEPEMYELVCRSADDRKAWVKIIREAIQRCPEEDEGVPSESEEERKLLEARAAKMRQIINSLHEKDSSIQACCEEKMKLVTDMQELFCKEGETPPPFKSVYKDEEEQELIDPDILVQEVSNEATRLLSLVHQSQPLLPSLVPASSTSVSATNLYRSATSVGERESGTYSTPPLPKRAETFSGFDGREREKGSVKRRYPSSIQDCEGRADSIQDLLEADSGVSLDTDKKTNLQRRQSFAVVKLDEATKDRMSRRMSTSFLQHLLIKQHASGPTEKPAGTPDAEADIDDGIKSSDRSSSGSVPDLSPTIPAAGMITTTTVLPSMREQCNCAAQLLCYVNSLVAITAQQSTEVESFRAMLQEANSKVSMLYTESHAHSKSYHHDKQLEELRNLQEQLRSERTDLAAWKATEQSTLDQQREELRTETARLDAQKAEVQAQREELHKQKEMLQIQMDLFEQQKRQHEHRERSQSPAASAVVLYDMAVSHKRSASDDLHNIRAGSPLEAAAAAAAANKAEYSNSMKETGGRGAYTAYADSSKKEVKSRSQSVSSTGRKDSTASMPMHLLSTTNEQKLSHFGGNPAVVGGTSTGAGGSPPQMLPHKLSASTSPALSRPPKPRGPLAPPARLMHAKSQPQLNVGGAQRLLGGRPTTPGATPSAANVLPMKLAELTGKQRPKSAGAPSPHSSSSSSSPTSSNKKTQEIIYF